MSSRWTHSICSDCWDERNPSKLSPRRETGAQEVCCYCGRTNTSGIFVRDNPDVLRCKGVHQEE